MKVILVNGSPNKDGSINKILEEVSLQFKKNGIETSIFWLGNKAISGCIGCGSCNKTGKCFIDDKVNEFLELAEDSDGFVFATPVHFAGMSGFIKPFLDRVFFGSKNNIFRLKPISTVVCARRGGASSALDDLNKYPMFANMILVSSNYWNMVYGANKYDVTKDKEGMQTVKVMADNMSYILHLIENGNKNNILKPDIEKKIKTNFINN